MAESDQIESTVQQLAELHEAHRREATEAQRLANRITGSIGTPIALIVVLALVVLWMIGNYVVMLLGGRALEGAPFPELGLLVTVVALLVALLILTTQRHEQAMADKRAQLTLQIAVLSEKKIAKLIAMVEELRQGDAGLRSTPDREAEEMAHSADPVATMEKIATQDASA